VTATRIGLIAGNGRLPFLFASAAKEQGLSVIAVGHQGDTDVALESAVDELAWVRVGQVRRIAQIFRGAGVNRAVMAGGIGKLRAFTEARPDLGALQIVAKLKSFRDDALLRAIAQYFEENGVEIAAPSEFLGRLLAPVGLLAGRPLEKGHERDIGLGIEVAALLGKADVGQTVVVRKGNVVALEAAEGTDETILRGGKLAGPGAVVVKLCKPGQDERFDLPAVGLKTLEVMREAGASVLAVEANRTFLLDTPELLAKAEKQGVTVVGVARG
jgi:DUF1009 family protein